MTKRIGLIGYGALGQFLASRTFVDDIGLLQFVCNRSVPLEMPDLPCPITLLNGFSVCDMQNLILQKHIDLVVEVAHPSVTELYGEAILHLCDYMVGSSTVFANEKLLHDLLSIAKNSNHHLFLPVGALWGAEDILRMAHQGTLKGLSISMTKHPSCFRFTEASFNALNNQAMETGEERVLLEGPVALLCQHAPNNVNTMAVAAIAASSLGFSKCIGKLTSDPNLKGFHKIEIDVTGPQNVESGGVFTVKTVRLNPAALGKVTGEQTYASFLSSLKNALSFPGPCGLHIC